MFKNNKNDYMSWFIFIGVVLVLLEILFFNKGLLFSLFISCGMIYLGRKRIRKKRGKLLFFGGIFFLAVSLLNMLAFKFLFLAIILYFFIQYFNSKKHPKKLSPMIEEPQEASPEEPLIKTKPLFENLFLGQQKTPANVYEWNDVNIQAGIGDTIIDLSMTMLPKGETVILIRNLFGNVQIFVPYDIELTVVHSSLIGSASVCGNRGEKNFNQVIMYKTTGYEQAGQKVKIVTSLIAGNLEVSRI